MRLEHVGLVLLSAVAHVFWNLHLKRSASPIPTSWWLQAYGALLAAPVGLALAGPVTVSPRAWACVALSGALYAAYYFFISFSYRSEDLSRAYPIARGVAPAATVLWGGLFFGEHPTPGGWAGIAAIVLAVFLILAPDLRTGALRLSARGLMAAVATGICTSLYSAVDRQGVMAVHPAIYLPLAYGAGALAEAPLLLMRHSVRDVLRAGRVGGWPLVVAGGFSSLGYLLVLTALREAPLSYVVPLRSTSVLLSVIAGAAFLKEGAVAWRVAAACLVALGVAAIALSG